MRFVFGALRVIGRIVYGAFVAALLAALVGTGLLIAFPPVVSQGSLDGGVPGAWQGDLPHARQVSIVDKIEIAGVASPQDGVWAGLYDASSRQIRIVKTGTQLTLAHEYGHALLHDLLLERCADRWEADALFSRIEETDQSSGPEGLPVWLTAAYLEYQSGPPTPFGSSYFGDSFGEDFAESFAWYTLREGTDVGPEMTALLAGVEKPDR